MSETRPSVELTAKLVMAEPKFDWSSYLQRHLTHPGVVVSKLHPIMGLRLAALFVYLTKRGHASDTPGKGKIEILSGVRTKAQQTVLYNDICLRQHRCKYVANPTRVHGSDAEGVQRQGSNHQAQRQSWSVDSLGRAEVGYAVDLRNGYGKNDAAWKPVHDVLGRFGLDWPLKTGAVERWHIEWFPRSRPAPLEGKRAWPDRPGVHRPLRLGHMGGDVRHLQRQAGVMADGKFMRGTEAAVKDMERELGLKPNGVWTERNQNRWEKAHAPTPAPPPAPAPAPTGDAIRAATASIVKKMAEIDTRLGEVDVRLDIIGNTLDQIDLLAGP